MRFEKFAFVIFTLLITSAAYSAFEPLDALNLVPQTYTSSSIIETEDEINTFPDFQNQVIESCCQYFPSQQSIEISELNEFPSSESMISKESADDNNAKMKMGCNSRLTNDDSPIDDGSIDDWIIEINTEDQMWCGMSTCSRM